MVNGEILLGAGKGDFAGAGQFCDSKRTHQGKELVDLALGARDLDRKAFRLNVDDLGAEDIADLHDLASGLGIGLHADKHELAVDIVRLAEVLDADDVHELVELLVDLIQHLVVPANHDSHAGCLGVKSRADVQGVDIEAASAEHAGDTGEDTEFVFDENGDGVAHRSFAP